MERNEGLKNTTSPEGIVLKSLPDFINTHGKYSLYCIVCSSNLQNHDVVLTDVLKSSKYSTLKDTCVKIILPKDNVKGLKMNIEDSIPFCKKCIKVVDKLGELYEALQKMKKQFEGLREKIAKGIIKSFVDIKGHRIVGFETEKSTIDLESKTFNYWKHIIDASRKKADEVPLLPSQYRSSSQLESNFETDTEFDLEKVKHEFNEEDIVPIGMEEDEKEPEEFIIPEIAVSFDKKSLYPIVKIERLPKSQLTRQKYSDSDTDDDKNEDSDGVLWDDSESRSNPDDASDSKVSSLSDHKIFSDSEDEEYPAASAEPEEDYIPPYELEVKTRNRIITRTRKRKFPLEDFHNSEKVETNIEYDDSSSSSETSESETETYDTSDDEELVRVKKKFANNIKSKNNSVQRKIQSSKPSSMQDGKPKPKRIRKKPLPAKCELCDHISVSKYHLKNHMRIHSGEKPFKCSYCPLTFYKKSNRTRHETNHVADKPHLCDHCDLGFSEKVIMKAHRLRIHLIYDSNRDHACQFCLKRFAGPKELQDHIVKQHDLNKTNYSSYRNIHCSVCLCSFETLQEITEHEQTDQHHATIDKKRNIRCNLCKIENFDSLGEFQAHLLSVEHLKKHKEIEDLIQYTYCTICKKSFNTRDELTQHKNSNEHKEAKWQKTCPDCGMFFSQIHLYKTHRENNHSSEDYQCEVCGKGFTTHKKLKYHLVSHHSSEKPFNCGICGKSFGAKRGYQTHLKTHGNSKHQCELCGKVYKSTESLNRHNAVKHTEPGTKSRKYMCQCKICPDVFEKPFYVRKHMYEKHTDIFLKDKPVVCKLCLHNFANDADLQSHMPYHDMHKCNICGRVFRMKVHLTKHVRTHTGEKPFECSICQKTFGQEYNLKEHMFRHTGERPYRCAECGEGFLRKNVLQRHKDKAHGPSNQDPQNKPHFTSL